MRCAFSSPSRSGHVTEEQPSGGTPSFANGSEKEALSLATIASMSTVEVTAAPIAGPLTAATIGFGKFRKVPKHFSFWLRICFTSFDGAIGWIIELRSTPAE